MQTSLPEPTDESQDDIEVHALLYEPYGQYQLFILTSSRNSSRPLPVLRHSVQTSMAKIQRAYKNTGQEMVGSPITLPGLAALYKQAQEKLVELAPMVYLLHTEYITGVSTNVKGFSTHPSGMYLLRNVTIEE